MCFVSIQRPFVLQVWFSCLFILFSHRVRYALERRARGQVWRVVQCVARGGLPTRHWPCTDNVARAWYYFDFFIIIIFFIFFGSTRSNCMTLALLQAPFCLFNIFVTQNILLSLFFFLISFYVQFFYVLLVVSVRKNISYFSLKLG